MDNKDPNQDDIAKEREKEREWDALSYLAELRGNDA